MKPPPELTRRQHIALTLVIAVAMFIIGFCVCGCLYGQSLVIERQGTNVLISAQPLPGHTVTLKESRTGAVWLGDPDGYGQWSSWSFPIETNAVVLFRAVHTPFDFQDNPIGLLR